MAINLDLWKVNPPLDPTKLQDGDLIGRGGNGGAGGGYETTVRQSRYEPTGAVYAKKTMRFAPHDRDAREELRREIQILNDCNCPQIVTFIGSYCVGPNMHILTEYMDVGSLDQIVYRIGCIEEQYVRHIAKQVLLGLHYLRFTGQHNILHRDIKPQNILVNRLGQIKLCDFGISRQIAEENSQAGTWVGTRVYMAPEKLTGEHYGTRSDVWSLGISLIEIATGQPAYRNDDDQNNIINTPEITIRPHAPVAFDVNARHVFYPLMSDFEFMGIVVEGQAPKLPGQFSPQFQSFVSLCCQKDPNSRGSLCSLIGIDRIGNVMEPHPFIRNCDDDGVDLAAWAISTLP